MLLKYRVTDVGPYPKSGPYPESPMALEDAQRALGLVRFHAVEWHINPHKIGVLGFSSGGHLSAAISTHYARRLYPAVDAADKRAAARTLQYLFIPVTCRWLQLSGTLPKAPKSFAVPHPANADRQICFNPEIPVTPSDAADISLQNEDDHVDNVDDALAYYIALKNAGVPVEMHLYAQGGHAFGLRRTKFPATAWPTWWKHGSGRLGWFRSSRARATKIVCRKTRSVLRR